MFPLSRVGDLIDHGGSIITGSPDVLIDGIPAALAGISSAVCPLHPSAQVLVSGSATVFINDVPAAMAGGKTSCGSVVTSGSPDVLIGS
ncbi:PAAR domain-containing protein [Paraburkholderia sp. J12]|uniref:PAAR domain-containing protein n=1 Tax=Paraburkholderia sp. J12 TaxID=2805432 RepID=UPI002ABD6A76|nr:PAAR domain-containing protein [Paraburkholderia sp. J12]